MITSWSLYSYVEERQYISKQIPLFNVNDNSMNKSMVGEYGVTWSKESHFNKVDMKEHSKEVIHEQRAE